MSGGRPAPRIHHVILLLACLAAAAFMAGLSWFVGVVHYPLFTGVGGPGWSAYHRRHSDRTTLVVVAPMLVELVTATAIAFDPPNGVSAGAAAGGMALALGTWALTARASLLHRRLGDPLDPDAHRSLLAAHHMRTTLWSLHAVLTAAMVTQAASST